MAREFAIPSPIFAREWNEERREARRARPMQGVGTRLFWTSDGVLISLAAARTWRHPWELSPAWVPDPQLAAGGKWVAAVAPGFVNGRDVTIEVREKVQGEVVTRHAALTDDPAPTIDLGGYRNPLASAGFTVTEGGDVVDLPGEGYPPFFDEIGVAAPAGSPAIDGRTRQLRASDLVLITPRFGARQTVDVLDPLTVSQTVTISTTYLNGRLASAPSRNYLVTLPRWTPTAAPTPLDRLAGTGVEQEQDELKIATIYLVSPEETGADAEPDDTWEVYVAYSVFWNLAWASRAIVGDAPPDPINLHVGLIAGVGDALIDFLLSPVNDLFAQVSAYLGSADFAGLYWSPGMLGASGITASAIGVSAQTTGLGLDPAALRIARQRAEEAAATVPPLNPEFPYRRVLFDPFYFGLDAVPFDSGSSQ